jgi:hypothetical protein
MAAKILTDDIIANEAIICLTNNMCVVPLVDRQYEDKFHEVGDTIRVRKMQRAKIKSGIELQEAPVVELNTHLTLDNLKQYSFRLGAVDRTLSISELASRHLETPMAGMANEVDFSLLLNAKAAYHTTHTPGSTPGAYADWAAASALCTDLAWPQDRNRRAVINPITKAVLGNEVKSLFNEQMVKDTYVNGYSGDVDTFSMHVSQNLRKHTTGAWNGTTLVTATAVVANSDGTSSIEIDGCGSNVAQFARAGDIITIADVQSVNPQNYQSTGNLQSFVIMADATSAGGVVTVKVSPQLNDGTLTTTNANGQTVSLAEYQNVTALPANNAAVTFSGSPSTTYREDFIFHKNALCLAMAKLYIPDQLKSTMKTYKGISMSYTRGGRIENLAEIHRLDMLYGTGLVIPDLAMRVLGDNV